MPPVVAAGAGVQRAAVGELADVVGDQLLHRLGGARPANVTSPMCETSNRPAASRTALCSSRMPRVLHRHRPAAEVDHLGAERDVASVKRGLLEWYWE